MNTRPPSDMPTGLADAVTAIRSSASRAARRLHLVPSEAAMSPTARLPLATDLHHRYFFNEHLDPVFWQFRGGQDVGYLEQSLALPALRRLSGARHVNIRPLSGLNAMLLVVAAFGGAVGDTIVSIAPRHGGHYATGNVVTRTGRRPASVEVSDGHVDLDELAAVLTTFPVSLVYLDLQNSLVELDVGPVSRTIAALSPETWLHVDSSHTLGLILGGAHSNPLRCGAGSFGGSTHKSFPGPHKGALFTDDDNAADMLRRAQFDLVSSHHFAETIALALAAAEFEIFGAGYAESVVDNARSLAAGLQRHHFPVVGPPGRLTDTHQIWVPYGDLESTYALGDALAANGILVNVQDDLPGLPGPAFRLGVNEVTFLGAGSDAMTLVAESFARARDGRAPHHATEIMKTFGPPHYFDLPP